MPNNITRQYQRHIKIPVELLPWSSVTKQVYEWNVPDWFCRKCPILEVSLGSQYTLSFEMLLDRFGQSNRFWKKSYKLCWNIQSWVLWRSWGLPMNVRLGCPLDVISGRPIDVRLGGPRDVRLGHPRDGQIRFLWGFLGMLERDFLGTNVCRLRLLWLIICLVVYHWFFNGYCSLLPW